MHLSNHKNAVSYLQSDSPPIEFGRLNLPSLALLKTSGGISVSFHASNDNAWTVGKPASIVPVRMSGDQAWTGADRAASATPQAKRTSRFSRRRRTTVRRGSATR